MQTEALLLGPIVLLIALAIFFASAAMRASKAPKEAYRRVGTLLGVPGNVVRGQMASEAAVLTCPEVHCGMVAKHEGKLVVLSHQAKLSDSTLSQL